MATTANLIHATTSSFERDVMQSQTPVVVDFYADWCGPCKMLAPHFAALADEYAGRVKFVKVNVDEDNELAARYGISGVPTLLFFKGGRLADSVVGLLPPQSLRQKLDEMAA